MRAVGNSSAVILLLAARGHLRHLFTPSRRGFAFALPLYRPCELPHSRHEGWWAISPGKPKGQCANSRVSTQKPARRRLSGCNRCQPAPPHDDAKPARVAPHDRQRSGDATLRDAGKIWSVVWRPRRDLNPCYRRERIAIARNPWRASGMDGSLQCARKRPREMLDRVLDPGKRRMDRNWTDAGDRFAGR